MKAISFSVAVLFISLLSCCKDKYTDDDFVLNKTEYTGDQLKIDGYYYSQVEGEEYYRLYIFYQNGITLLPGIDNDPYAYISNILLDSSFGDAKYVWGLFIIEDNIIKIEYYEPKMIEGMPAYLQTGDIINDTTFVITEVKRSKDGSEYRTINETYHYQHYNPKPDSTNNFVK
jgi:hypothetical protein